MSKDDSYIGVLLEDINDKFDRVIEVVGALSDELKTKADKDDVQNIRDDIRMIKTAVAEHTHEIEALDTRVTRLEAR